MYELLQTPRVDVGGRTSRLYSLLTEVHETGRANMVQLSESDNIDWHRR